MKLVLFWLDDEQKIKFLSFSNAFLNTWIDSGLLILGFKLIPFILFHILKVFVGDRMNNNLLVKADLKGSWLLEGNSKWE